MEGSLSNYIRTNRKRTGLSQRELARILGNAKVTVSRHERTLALPPLVSALVYEVLFEIAISQLFAGVREAVEQNVEERLSELEEELRRKSGLGMRTQTLDWIATRRAALQSSMR